MGQDWYGCDNCGEAISDYHPGFTSCDCGKVYCCEECAEENGFINYHEQGLTPPKHEKYDYEIDRSCQYCRGENVEEGKLLEFALELLEIDKSKLLEKYKANKI